MNESYSDKKAVKVVEKMHTWANKRIDWLCDSWLGRTMTIVGQLVLYAVVFFFVFQFLGSLHLFGNNPTSEVSLLNDSTDTSTDENCNVMGINLHGYMRAYIPEHNDYDPIYNPDEVASDNITGYINSANYDEQMKAILIEVDSGGGAPIAGEEIDTAIKNSEKPVVVFIRTTGASSAYWAISGADKIFASKLSDVGGIGITMSYLEDNTKINSRDYKYIPLSIGKFKDAGDIDKPITEEEKALYMRDIKITFQNFIETVSKNRNISIEKVKVLADGSTVLGERAKEVGLIDEIGGIHEAESYIQNIIDENVDVCWQ